MAQMDLGKIKKISKMRNNLHERVFTTYSVFESGGDRYIQFDTYGKSNRENPEKISQSIQIDKNTAEFLIELLKKEFDLN